MPTIQLTQISDGGLGKFDQFLCSLRRNMVPAFNPHNLDEDAQQLNGGSPIRVLSQPIGSPQDLIEGSVHLSIDLSLLIPRKQQRSHIGDGGRWGRR